MRCFRKQFLLVLIGYIMMIHLVIICGAENVEVKSDKSSYGGLRREFQEADVIFRLEVIDCKAVNLTADSNNNQNIAEEMEIKGKVISLFKGEISKVGDILTLYVRFADHWRSIQKFRSHCPICFTVPDKGKNAVFLVKKTRRRLEIVNIILPEFPATIVYTSKEYQETVGPELIKSRYDDDTFVRNYILLAKTNNKQAAFNLTKFISNDTLTLEYEDYDYFNDYLQTYFYDWKLLYSYLPRESKEFEKLLENYFPCVIKVIKDTPTQDPGGHRLFWGIWLTTMMDGSQRKEVVKTLLEAYEQVRIKLEEREEQFNKEEKLREEFREKERRLKSSEDVLVRHNVVICDNIPWVRSIPFLIDSKLPYWIYSVMHPESVNYEDLIVPANFWKNTEAILNEANEFIKQ